MKRFVTIGIVFLLLVLLCACGGTAGPEAAVRTALDGLREYNFDKVEPVLSVDELMNFSEDVKGTFSRPAATAALFRYLSYEVTAVREEEDSAQVDVTITNVEFSSFLGNYMNAFMTLYLENAQAQEKLDDEALMDKAAEQLAVFTDEHQGDTVQHTVTVSLTKTEKGWKINPDKALADAVFGGIISASEALQKQE